jgi:hypothetical protein
MSLESSVCQKLQYFPKIPNSINVKAKTVICLDCCPASYSLLYSVKKNGILLLFCNDETRQTSALEPSFFLNKSLFSDNVLPHLKPSYFQWWMHMSIIIMPKIRAMNTALKTQRGNMKVKLALYSLLSNLQRDTLAQGLLIADISAVILLHSISDSDSEVPFTLR